MPEQHMTEGELAKISCPIAVVVGDDSADGCGQMTLDLGIAVAGA
jgi:hypothetical protein